MALDNPLGTRLDLRLTQRLVMTPQLQQAIRLLHLSRAELTQEIQQQMMDNPLLEEVTSDLAEDAEGEDEEAKEEKEAPSEPEESELSEESDLKWDNYYEEDDLERVAGEDLSWAAEARPSYEQTLATPLSLTDHLLWQLGLSVVTQREREIGAVLIGNIGEEGYLEASLEEVANSANASYEETERVLKVVQTFDPPGVGARHLIECLLIQMEALGLAGSLVETLIKNHLVDMEKRRYAFLAKTYHVSLQDILQASKIIGHLEPKPGRRFCVSENVTVIPDVFVIKPEESRGGRYTVLLNDDGLPKLRISPYYRLLIHSKEGDTEATRRYLEEKWRSGVWWVRSLEQRNRTILKVAESILKFQYAFMENGILALKPLVLKRVADDISMHESTVSRCTTNKYMQTPHGLYEMKFFFNHWIPSVRKERGGGEPQSSVAARKRIEQMIAQENALHPLTDQEIVERLRQEDVEIARRTVSKYRAVLKIAPATRRRHPD